MYEILALSDVEPYPLNPKIDKPGKEFQRGLDAMLKHFGFVGSMSLSPRCTEEEAPALAAAFGAHGRHIIGDGHLRRETLPTLGWKWVLVQPGPASAEGDPEFLERLASIPKALRSRYREMVQAGERIALGTVYPFLNTPDQLALFTLGHDGARRSYDEAKKDKIREMLLGEGRVAAKLVHDVAISSQASIRRVIDATKQAERDARDRAEQERKAQMEAAAREAAAAGAEAREQAGEEDAPRAPAPSSAKPIRAGAQVVYTPPLRLSVGAFSELERLLKLVRSHALAPGREGRFLSVVERAARRLELGDAAVEVLVERVKALGVTGQAENLAALHEAARKLRADDDVLMAACIAAARDTLEAVESDTGRSVKR